MRPRSNGVSRSQREQRFEGGGPNWILIAGGALLSTLTIRLGSKLKQTLDSRRETNASNGLPGNEGTTDVKYPPNDHTLSETDGALPLVTVNAPEYSRENGIMWVSSLERLELPPKPFHHSNCSDSPCVSESGSDIFSKREVIQKLRQQLKRRDDMIIEMQDQIVELQNSVNAQLGISNNLQSQLDVANKDLLDSEREIQRLRKAIADHCLKHVRNGHANGYSDGESTFEFPEKGRMDVEKVEMLRREVGELKEVLEGKEYLLQNYKEQKSELSMKIKELQQRLDSQLPNIL
ncbi:unnamed protein product [Linum tenue]|uniref:Uncharacterized protein n=1 Tax=Linum tenue TaxID=586396 RepID=A0AAV0JMV3_9ROSI|nr:unnamed protein product [Linum tenue]